MMPLKPLLKNKLLLQKHYHVSEFSIDEWPFWLLEENIKIINELTKCLKEIKINLKFKFSKRAVFFNTLLTKKKKKQ